MTETREQRLERWARVLCEWHIRAVRRHDTAPDQLEEVLPRAVDYAWPEWREAAEAIDASNAAAGMVLMPSTIEDGDTLDRTVDTWGRRYQAYYRAIEAIKRETGQ